MSSSDSTGQSDCDEIPTTTATPCPSSHDVVERVASKHGASIPPRHIHQYAFDTLSCPAMSTECERVFSGAKRTISSDRNRRSEGVLEACECLKVWCRNGIIKGTQLKKRKADEMADELADEQANGDEVL